jgi:hypothetical protein
MAALFFQAGLTDADSMLAAGSGYYPDNTSTQGDLSMTVLCHLASLPPLSRVRASAVEQLAAFNCTSGDIRWAVVGLALCLFTTLLVSGQEQLRLMSALLTIRWQQGVARVASSFRNIRSLP